MVRHVLLISLLICGHIAIGQDPVQGDYSGSEIHFDSIRFTVYLSLQPDGSYSMRQTRGDSSVTTTGKWYKRGDDIRLKPGYSKSEEKAWRGKAVILNIEHNKLIWKPYKNKRELKRAIKKFERAMSERVGEKVSFVVESKSLILCKEK